MAVFQFPLSPAVSSNVPYARRGRAFGQPLIDLWVTGPKLTEKVRAVLDPGGECCLFPEWVAWRIGLRQTPSSPIVTMGSSVTLTGLPAWFAPVGLDLRDPAGVHRPFRWTSVVGFTGRGSFAKSAASGILGINGGLDQFQRVEFDWSAAGGPEVVVRV